MKYKNDNTFWKEMWFRRCVKAIKWLSLIVLLLVFRNKVKAKRKLKDQISLQTSMKFTHNLLVWPMGGKNVNRYISVTSLSSQFSKTCKITNSFSSVVQKGHLGVLWLNPCSKQGQLDQIALGLAWSSFKYLQEWKFNNLSGQPVLTFDHLHGKTNK